MKNILLALIVFVCLLSCKADKETKTVEESLTTVEKESADLSNFEPKVREIAESICECAQPYLDFQKKAMTGGKISDEQAADFTAHMQDAMAEMSFCMEDLQEEYPDFDPDTQFKRQLRKAMRKKCPGSLMIMAQYLGD